MVDTLCFIPCCKRKRAASEPDTEAPVLTAERIPGTWRRLEAGRKAMRYCIEENGRPCRALRLFDGYLYNPRPSFRDDIERAIGSGRLDIYILSPAYGVVQALDPILPYEADMRESVATMWRDKGLTDVIAELIRVSRARRVFGFFSGRAHWNGLHAKYRYFFTEGVKAAASSGAALDTAACFYRWSGNGAGPILGSLGRALLHGLHADFSPRILDEYAAGRADGNVIVKSEMLVDTALARRSAGRG